MPGKFVVKKGSTGKFRFSLLSTNGQIVATSEAYNTKESALKGIDAIKSLASDATVEDQTAKEWQAADAARKAAKVAKRSSKKSAAPREAMRRTPGHGHTSTGDDVLVCYWAEGLTADAEDRLRSALSQLLDTFGLEVADPVSARGVT